MPATQYHAQVQVRLASPSERAPLYRMLELYQYELSDIWDQDLDETGEYGYALDRYWQAAGNYPYVALAGGHYVGLALVDDRVKLPEGQFWMDQFFVLKKYRREGIGNELARRVIAQHPGRWQIGQMTENTGARFFWRQVIERVTRGAFEEQKLTSGWWQGYVQTFTSKAESAA